MIIEIVCVGITACFSFIAGALHGADEALISAAQTKNNNPSSLPFNLDEFISRIELGMFKISSSVKERIAFIIESDDFKLRIPIKGGVWLDNKANTGELTIKDIVWYFNLDDCSRSSIISAINNLNKNKVNSIFEEMDINHNKSIMKSLDRVDTNQKV